MAQFPPADGGNRRAGFGLLIYLVAMSLACGSFAPRPGQSPTPSPTATIVDSPTPRPTQVVTPPPADTPVAVVVLEPTAIPSPTPLPEPTALPTPDANIQIGQQARIVARTGINIRQEPARSAKRVATYPSGSLVVVVDGPVDEDDLVWWQVDNEHGKAGWVAGGDGTELWLNGDIGEPRPVNRAVRPGDRVSVSVQAGKTLAIRYEPAKKALVARRVVAATKLTIIGGPVIAGNMRWWRVQRKDGLTGWAAEGDGETRWLKPIE